MAGGRNVALTVKEGLNRPLYAPRDAQHFGIARNSRTFKARIGDSRPFGVHRVCYSRTSVA